MILHKNRSANKFLIKRDEKMEQQIEEKKKNKLKIPLWKIIAFFIIYSILGYIIETIFGLVTKGVLESRKNFLHGPFCCIYGIGGLVVVLGLQRFKKNNYTIFAGGFIIGSIVEYLISLIGELIFHIKWWDYSDMPFNINGRICIAFSFLWGMLAILIICHIHPQIENIINKFKPKTVKLVSYIILIYMFISFFFTSFALQMFFARLVEEYDLELKDMGYYLFDPKQMYSDPNIKKFADRYFTNEKMLKTFPNIKVTDKEGNVIYVSTILKDIKPYYFRIFTPKNELKINILLK